MKSVALIALFVLLSFKLPFKPGPAVAATAGKDGSDNAKVLGTWNITVTGADGGKYPSWIEISATDGVLSGRICARVGSAHPLKRVQWDGKEFLFSETVRGKNDQKVEKIYKAKFAKGRLQGEITIEDHAEAFVAVRSPQLKVPGKVKWGKDIDLLAKGLIAWRPRNNDQPGCWSIADGVLSNKKPCVDIISEGKYLNFRIHVEFKLGETGANSGVYLRGRHEVQINDDAGRPAESHATGSLYGLITPTANPAKPVGEWQIVDITLLGRRLKVVLNGVTIIDDQNIPGPTGGALDSDEARPGPIMLQGDHGVVSFRNVTLTPVL